MKSIDDLRRDFLETHPSFSTAGTTPVSAELISAVTEAETHNALVRRVAELEKRIEKMEAA